MFDSDVPYYSLDSYLEQLASLRDAVPTLKNADLVVCTAALTCSFLRAVLPDVPFVGYLGMSLHVSKNQVAREI